MAGWGSKGSAFEREICKKLSLWWTGNARDDIYWRSSQSGGRATQRLKSGRSTFGSYGDIAFVDPIGEPLLRLFTIELKRGRSHGHPEDLMDCAKSDKQKPFESCLMQAYTAHQAAGSRAWMLICRRDCKIAMVYFPTFILVEMEQGQDIVLGRSARYDLWIKTGVEDNCLRFRFVGVPLDRFLEYVTPGEIVSLCPDPLR